MDPILANPNSSTNRRPKINRGGVRGPSTNDLRISTCGICPAGIFDGDDKTWGNGIDAPIGWNHTGCVQQGGSHTDG